MVTGRAKARAMVGYRFPRFVSHPVVAPFALWMCLSCQSVSVDNQVTLFVSVEDGVTREPLDEVELCEFDTENCSETDGGGLAVLELPTGQNVLYSLTKDGYGSVLVADRTDETFNAQTSRLMLSNEWHAERSTELGTEWPLDGQGAIWVFTAPAMGGVTFELPEATREAHYAWYDDETGWHSSYGLDKTTADGVGGFQGVPAPDEYRVRIGGTAQRCTPQLAWASDEPNEVIAPVRPNYTTYVWVHCNVL